MIFFQRINETDCLKLKFYYLNILLRVGYIKNYGIKV